VLKKSGTVLAAVTLSLAAFAAPAVANTDQSQQHQAAQSAGYIPTPVSDGDVGIQAWECPEGFSCYYDWYGTGRIWIAPSCGWHNLGALNPPLHNRVSSIMNRGNGTVRLYDYIVDRYVEIFSVGVGRSLQLEGSSTNVIDAVEIEC
jgi:hypothetical protein